ncbi:HEXXH motif domain-containing protein [Nocardiopsis sp. MG754419]|uniref:HEXXH motif domain-containing protein n=1 Tax=Nocardiopsis sp. MG754419 TaxID=2259865 RepID=UPI001BA557E1|nr:HEXXH motif domain-containing protein [Nocardiopsis sp. MG754419]MBR8743012.1 HEXXH motif domain-containing protein [Nocardiopsis sp. MG754419]
MPGPVPDPLFDALARGGGGHAAAAHLRAAQYGKHLLLLRRVVDVAREVGHPEADRAHDAFALVARAQEHAPGPVGGALRTPAVGVWARRTALALAGHRPEPPRVGTLGALAAAAALRAGVDARVEIPLDGPTAPLPSLGRALVGEGASALVEVGGGRATVRVRGGPEVEVPEDPHEDAPGWHALRRLVAEHRGGRVELFLDDQDPDRMPGTDLVAHRLGVDELRWWRHTLQGAWELLVDHHGTLAAETDALVVTLTPLTAPGGRVHTSATTRHAFGNLGLSRPEGAVPFALTFAHEVQHAKLTALLDLVALTRSEDGSRYYAPWRPDPRPASGLLQGVYAHLGVAGFWRRHRHVTAGEEARRAHVEFAHWRRSTVDAARALADSGRLTTEGRRFLALTDRTLRDWCEEPVPDEAERAARDAARRHLARWRARNGAPW